MAEVAGEDSKTIACQQVLTDDGSVYSVQSMAFSEKYAEQITTPLLLDRYLKLIRKWTLSVIRPFAGPEGVQFRLLWTSLALLSFDPPQYFCSEGREEVRLQINGGFLVQANECNRGMFSFVVERGPEGLLVTVQLADFCPLLLGSRNPSVARRLLYRFTQAYIHQVVTVRFLSHLYRDVTGSKCHATVRKVRLREGRDT